ncbi:hypothetical protein [Porphyromonas endodontalis]
MSKIKQTKAPSFADIAVIDRRNKMRNPFLSQINPPTWKIKIATWIPRGYRITVDYRLFMPSGKSRIDYSESLSEAELP